MALGSGEALQVRNIDVDGNVFAIRHLKGVEVWRSYVGF